MNTLTGKRLLVTGGAGFIGSHLVDRLVLDNPSELVIVDNFFLGRDDNLAAARNAYPDLNIIRMDAADLAAMRQIVNTEKIEVIFDLAVIPLPTSLIYPAWTVHSNVGIATTMCELARGGDIATLIHFSSSEGYGSAQIVPMNEQHPLAAITPYAASKAAGDQVVLSYQRTFGIDAAIVRPFNQFGPRQNAGLYAGIIPKVIRRVQMGQPVEIYGDGEQTRDYIFVRDTVDAVVKVYQQPDTRGQVLNLGSGREITVNALVQMLLEVIGTPTHPVIYGEARSGDVRRHCAGIDLARRLIAFDPPGVTAENLRETVAWYLQTELVR